MSVFDATLHTASKITRETTSQARAEALATTGRTAKALGMFRCLGNMLYNGDEMMEARRIHRNTKQRGIEEKQQRQEEEDMEVFEDANMVYLKYKDGERLVVEDLKVLVKFIIMVDKREKKETISQFNSRSKLEARLNSVVPSWEYYFDPRGSSNDDEDDDESGNDADDELVEENFV